MSPVKEKKTKTSIGLETAQQTVNRANELLKGTPQTNAPATITGESLTPVPTPVVVESTPTPTQNAALSAEIEDINNQYTQNLQKEAQALGENRKTQLDSFIESLGSQQGQVERVAREYSRKGGVDEIAVELNDINDRIRREQLAMRRATEAIQKQGGGLQAGAQAEIANIERDSLAKQADLAVIQMGIQGRYDSAKAIADRAVSAQLEQQTNDLAIAKFNYEENKELYTKAEQRAFEAAQADRERALTEQKENRTAIYDLGIQAQLDGAPTSVVEQMFKAKTREEAAAIGGQYIGALDREAKRANIAQSYASRRNSVIDAAKNGDPKAIQELGFDPNKSTLLGEYSNVIDTASLLVGAERGQETRRAMASAVERGDYTTAYSQIANNVQSNLQGEAASRFGAARTDIQVLSGLRDTIQEFEAQGGDTGFLKGNADVIARKFGQLATDPKFASLAVQLEREFQAYRQQMTGAAFGAGESADYEKVNPSSTKSLELNLATIDGALRQLENRVVGTVESYVPNSREIYDLASGNEKVINSSDPSKEPVGSVIEIGGVRYRKVGEDAYEPI